LISKTWVLTPGVWLVSATAFASATGERAMARHTLDVPSPGEFRVSTPLITDELDEDGTRPLLVLRREFERGRTIYCQVQVYGAREAPGMGPRVRMGWTLSRGGSIARSQAPTRVRPSSDGRLSRLIGLALEGAPPGQYVLSLIVHDDLTGATIRARETFRLIQK
jgi:hypothetical protein